METDRTNQGDDGSGGGWVVQVPGWVVRANYSAAIGLNTKYSESLYSVFKSKFAFTATEMRLAVLAELVLGLIFGSLAGVISSIMMTLGAGQQDSMLKLLTLRHWMRSRGLKTSDKAKIIAAFNQKQEVAGFDQQEILSGLPPSLAGDLCYFMYHFRQTLATHTRRVCLFVWFSKHYNRTEIHHTIQIISET